MDINSFENPLNPDLLAYCFDVILGFDVRKRVDDYVSPVGYHHVRCLCRYGDGLEKVLQRSQILKISSALKTVNSSKIYLVNAYARAVIGEDSACRSHALRHGFASAALEAGAAVDDISSVLGHANTIVTAKYTQRLNPVSLTESIGNLIDSAVGRLVTGV